MAKRSRPQAEDEVPAEDRDETMSIKPLGAGQEVGRSCIVVKYMGKTIMLDCGIHPGYTGEAALPFFDADDFDPAEVDLLIVSHFHLDHAAALPYFTEKTNFKGRIFMTHPTKAVMRMMLADYIKIVNVSTENVLYDEKDLNACIDKVELIDFHQVMEHEGIRFWCYNAGHVLGAAMFMIEVAGARVLYTGDYSMEEDRHLMRAEVPSMSPDVLIVESTYGVQVHSPKEEREARFTGTVASIVQRGGRCLIPVFALGRAQELLLILDQYWEEHPEVQHIPVYYASRMASKALRVYQTYVNMMNESIRRRMDVSNPFKFRHVKNLRGLDAFDDLGPSVVMAAPGMLQHGVSRELFDRWCTDERNGVLLAGYSVENTLAKKILTSPDEVVGMDGRVRRLRCTVEYVSFSAHVDFVQNRQFVEAVAPTDVVLVHGERAEMMRLQGELKRQFDLLPPDERPHLHTPSNTQEVSVTFPRDKVARAVGSVARRLEEKAGNAVGALLVRKDFDTRVLVAEEVGQSTQLRVGGVRQRLSLPSFYSTLQILAALVREVYDDVELLSTSDVEVVSGGGGGGGGGGSSGSGSGSSSSGSGGGGGGNDAMVVHGAVTVKVAPATASGGRLAGVGAPQLLLEWDASPANDMIADSLVTLAMQAQTSPGGIRLTSGTRPCRHNHGAGCGNSDAAAAAIAALAAPAAVGRDEDAAMADVPAVGTGSDAATAAAAAAAAAAEAAAAAPPMSGADAAVAPPGTDDKVAASSNPESAAAATAPPSAASTATTAQRPEEELADARMLAAARGAALRLLCDTYGEEHVSVSAGDGVDVAVAGSAGGGDAPLRVRLDGAHADVRVSAAPEADFGWSMEVAESSDDGLRAQLASMLGRLQEALAGVPPG